MPMTTSSQQSGSKNVINKKNTKTLTILLFNAPQLSHDSIFDIKFKRCFEQCSCG